MLAVTSHYLLAMFHFLFTVSSCTDAGCFRSHNSHFVWPDCLKHTNALAKGCDKAGSECTEPNSYMSQDKGIEAWGVRHSTVALRHLEISHHPRLIASAVVDSPEPDLRFAAEETATAGACSYQHACIGMGDSPCEMG